MHLKLTDMSRTHRNPLRRLKRALRRLHHDQRGATSLEFVLLLAGFGLPAFFLIRLGMDILMAHYRMITTLNALPLP